MWEKIKAKLNYYCHDYKFGKCSCWVDSFMGEDFSHCCETHDKDILQHRTKSVHEADNNLFKCVWYKSKLMAVLMWVGVKPMSWYYWNKK